MRNKLGNALIALGVLALLAAVLLMGYNQWDSTRAEKAADSVLTQLEESIAEPRTIYPGDAAEPTADTEMPVSTIDGYDYIWVPLYSVHRAGTARDAAVELSGAKDRAGAVFRLAIYR